MENRRNEERVRATLPVHLGSTTGTTRDVSASGIFFTTDAPLLLGSTVSFSVEAQSLVGKRVLRCLGTIVRVEPLTDEVGIAVRISEATLEPEQ